MGMENIGAINTIKDTDFGYTLFLISGKWKLIILYWLIEKK